MKSKALFSIITVCYNDLDNLKLTVNSMANQVVKNFEYIVIDGGSTDATKPFLENASIVDYWISESDNGLYDAMNKGLDKASGQYVWFVNAGDQLFDRNITEQLANFQGTDIIYGNVQMVNNEGEVLGNRRLKPPETLTFDSFKLGMLVSHQAFIVERKIASAYNINYRYSSDYDWTLRCLQKANSTINSGLTLIRYLDTDGVTKANLKASLKERFIIMSRYYGLLPTLIRHIYFAFRLILFVGKNKYY